MSQQIAGETTIAKLPENILLEILRYLPMKDRCRAGRVCKNWNRILSDNSLWRHVDLLEYRLDLRTMWKIVRTHFSPCLLTMKIRGYAHADGSKRRKISLSDAMLKELGTRCPNLWMLQLNDCKTSNISFESLPPSITTLEIVNSIWQPRWLKDKQAHLPNLHHLNFDKSVRVDDFDMEDVVAWKNLTSLSLCECYRVRTAGMKTIAEHLHMLEYLNLCGTHIDDLAVHYIARHLKNLKILCLARCIAVNDGAVAAIAMGLPVLDQLDISYCDSVTMHGLESLFVSKITTLFVLRSDSLLKEQKEHLQQGFCQNIVLVT